jgi:hypothetical protein
MYGISEWNENNENPCEEPYFVYYGKRYFMSEFTTLGFGSPFANLGVEIHGYTNDSFFSGILVQYHPTEELVKVYTFIG